MNILITSGIFEPESGGPATYAPRLAEKLIERGHSVKVITYSDEPYFNFDEEYSFEVERIIRKGKLSNYWRFFKTALSQIGDYDLVYTLDWTAAGFPVSLASRVKGVPYAVRVGGGYIWERYLDEGKSKMPLREFYEKEKHREYPILFSMIRFVLKGADRVIFNTTVQPDFFKEPYGLADKQVATIYNPVPEVPQTSREEPNDEIVFAGRFIEMKNVPSLVQAFAKADINKKLVLIGDGPKKEQVESLVEELGIESNTEIYPAMKQEKLFERIKNAYLIAQPSWTDISPNFIYEALSLDIPFLVTKENYLAIRDQIPIMVNPHSVDDIAEGLEYLENEDNYREFVEQLREITFRHGWDDVTDQHEQVFNQIVS